MVVRVKIQVKDREGVWDTVASLLIPLPSDLKVEGLRDDAWVVFEVDKTEGAIQKSRADLWLKSDPSLRT